MVLVRGNGSERTLAAMIGLSESREMRGMMDIDFRIIRLSDQTLFVLSQSSSMDTVYHVVLYGRIDFK